MIEFLMGFAACYGMGAAIVWRERREYFNRTADNPADVPAGLLFTLALFWPRTIGGK